jgi:ATP-binding cassette subfamily B (MDR/TAP) protein 1
VDNGSVLRLHELSFAIRLSSFLVSKSFSSALGSRLKLWHFATDEATSALDATSRVLVFEAIKRHRRRKTTIVITHDLSQITDDDYVYVMKAGLVVEEGFRADLAAVDPTPVVHPDSDEIIISKDSCRGEFRRMLDKQLKNGGFPIRDDVPDIYENARAEANDLVERALSPEPQNGPLTVPGPEVQRPSTAMSKRQSAIMWAPTVLGGAAATTSRAAHTKERAPIPSAFSRHNNVPWQMDAIHDILGPSTSGAQALSHSRSSKMPGSRIRGRYTSRGHSFSAESDEEDLVGGGGFDDDDDDDTTVHNSSGEEDDTKRVNDIPMRSRLHKKNASTSSLPSPSPDRAEFGRISIQNAFKTAPKRQSMTFEPWVYSSTPRKDPVSFQEESGRDGDSAIAYVVDDDDFEDERIAMEKSAAQVHTRRQNTLTVVVHDSTPTQLSPPTEEKESVPSLISVIRQFYSTVPRKPWIALGLLFAVVDGALTPVFSWALAQLMAEMGTGASGYNGTMKYGLMVLFVSLGNGVATGAKFYLLEDGAMRWVAGLRKASFARILRQDKTWFDESKHSPDRMVQILVKDGDDARTLIATVAGQALVVFTMVSLGIGWALVIGWQLTLVGLAIGPVFALAMMGQSVLTSRFELRNKRAREDVARRYYEVIANIRAIRSMALENAFSKHFEDSLEDARSTGVHGAFAAGLGYGVSQALIYLTQALLFWVGAKFIANGTYTYLRLVEVLDLLIFSVSIGGQLMTFGESFLTFKWISFRIVPLMSLLFSSPHCQVKAGCRRLRKAPRVGSL